MADQQNGFDPSQHLIDLKGKAYLPVAHRLEWVRYQHPDANIDTVMLEHDYQEGVAIFRCSIIIPGGGSSTGHGSETRQDFPQGYVEKAETKAIGRALAALGFGTQFAGDELDEGDRIVDAPIKVRRTKVQQQAPKVGASNTPTSEPNPHAEPPGLARLQYAGVCRKCGKNMPKDMYGFREQVEGGKWQVWHEDCDDLLANVASREPAPANTGP